MNSRKMTYLADLYSYIKNIGDKAVLSNKQIIIWGYSKGGAFVRRLLEEYDQRIRIAYIIDDCMQIPADFSPKLYRSTILEYIDGSRYILLSTIKDYLKVEKYAGEFGFISEQNMFDVRSRIGVSYIDFLQIKNDRLDFAYVTVKERPDIYSQPNVAISTPFEGVYVDKLFNDISILEEKISFLDYGCGKGQILFYAHVWGLDNVKGIEFVPEIADQANLNMKELNIPAHVICNDARAVTDIDDVNVFFFNNPFLGDIFETVIDNIEKSAIRNPRRIHIVYLNPRCHRIVIKNGIFKLDRQLYIDAGDPLANFYINEA